MEEFQPTVELTPMGDQLRRFVGLHPGETFRHMQEIFNQEEYYEARKLLNTVEYRIEPITENVLVFYVRYYIHHFNDIGYSWTAFHNELLLKKKYNALRAHRVNRLANEIMKIIDEMKTMVYEVQNNAARLTGPFENVSIGTLGMDIHRNAIGMIPNAAVTAFEYRLILSMDWVKQDYEKLFHSEINHITYHFNGTNDPVNPVDFLQFKTATIRIFSTTANSIPEAVFRSSIRHQPLGQRHYPFYIAFRLEYMSYFVWGGYYSNGILEEGGSEGEYWIRMTFNGDEQEIVLYRSISNEGVKERNPNIVPDQIRNHAMFSVRGYKMDDNERYTIHYHTDRIEIVTLENYTSLMDEYVDVHKTEIYHHVEMPEEELSDSKPVQKDPEIVREKTPLLEERPRDMRVPTVRNEGFDVFEEEDEEDKIKGKKPELK